MAPIERARRATANLMHQGPFGPDDAHDPSICVACQVQAAIVREIEEITPIPKPLSEWDWEKWDAD